MAAVGSQRERFESTRPAKLKAKECSDLVLLSLYVYIPPSRGLEIRSLEIVKDFSDLSPPKKSSDNNFIILMNDGDVRLQFNHYKTKRSRGRDELTVKVTLHYFPLLSPTSCFIVLTFFKRSLLERKPLKYGDK